MRNSITHIILLLLLSTTTYSCIFIDDDLTDCANDFLIQYEMRLRTNINIELSQVLHAQADSALIEAIKDNLQDVFSEQAHDVDLRFYNQSSGILYRSYQDIVDSNFYSLTIALQREQYRHLAFANIEDATNVRLVDTLRSESIALMCQNSDTIDSQTTGLFIARLDMDVKEDLDQVFDVNLYMANSAMALVIDTIGYSDIHDIKVFTLNTAQGIMADDSLYLFDRHPVVRAQEIDVHSTFTPASAARRAPQYASSAEHSRCYTTVTFPSDTVNTDNGYWQVDVYVTLPDSTITHTLLSIEEPLRNGDLKVVSVKMDAKGVLRSTTADVGASVELDWKPGNIYNPNL